MAGGDGGGPARPSPPPTPSLGRLVRSGLRLLVWGRSDMGQLGLLQAGGGGGVEPGGGGALWAPTLLEALADKDVVGMAGGPFHTAFVTADGELYTAGCNDNGQLGRRTAASAGGGGGGTPSSPPSSSTCSARLTHVTALESYNIAAAGCGASHTLVITEQGGALGWGGNEFGQTGCGAGGTDQHHPRPIKGLGDLRAVRAAVGANHALLLTGAGSVFAVGQGSFGALGLGDGLLESRATPVPVLPLMPLGVVQVAAGDNHSAALTADGRVFTWGRGKHGQLGHGNWDNRPRPVLVAALRGRRAKQVACGGDHTLVLVEAVAATSTSETTSGAGAGSGGPAAAGGGSGGGGGSVRGELYSFGRGTWGATGLGCTDNTCRPCRIHGLEAEDVVQVSAGSRHSLALAASHAVFAFGNNDFGQLGLGPPAGRPLSAIGRGGGGGGGDGDGGGMVVASPRRVASLPPLAVLSVVAAGDASMALLLQNARPGQLVLAGPRPGRRAGAHLAPYSPPDLRHLAATAAAAAAANEDTRAVRELVAAIEDVLSSPGYVLASFASSSSSSGSSNGSSSGGGFHEAEGGRRMTTTDAGPEAGTAMQPHGMDVSAIQACFEALLRLYNRDVVAALGSSLIRLLEAVLPQATAAAVGRGSPLGTAAGPSLRSFRGSAAAAAGGDGGDDGGDDGGGSAAASRLSLLRVLFVVFQCPLLAGSGLGLGLGSSLASRLISLAARLPRDNLQLLGEWLVSLPLELLGGRVVRPLVSYIGKLTENGLGARGSAATAVPAPGLGPGGVGVGGTGVAAAALGRPEGRAEVLAAARVLSGLHAANERAGGKLPFAEFYSQKLSSRANLRAEYVMWLEVAGGRPPVADERSLAALSHPLLSLCQAPFLLTPEAKSRILQGEALLQKEAEMSASAREALLQGLHPASAVFLDIAVRRGAALLSDAAQQLAGRPPHQLKRPLRVSFVSQGVAEEGLDQGGVSREFFQLLVAEIFQPQYGMFTYDEESRTFWFNTAACLEDEGTVGEFRLVGSVLGLAIYNGVILDVHFPQAVYKKLLGEAVGLGDLEEAFPTLGRSLRAVLAMDPDEVEGALCRNFEVQYDYFGATRTVPLIPGGSAVPVTGANREQYVRRLVEWTLVESVDTQFRAFAHGFHQVCGGPALSLFRHEELELLICGLPHLDFGALEANARYEGGYHRQHPTIIMFWQVISELDLNQKRRFLAFTTGCDRAPVAGLGALVLVVQRAGPDTDRLPTAHTCFNALLLPEYGNRTKLRAKLLTAIQNAQGFGLK